MSSSESDSYLRGRGYRSRGRDARPRDRRGGARVDGDISAKIDTLANTLQDTNRNLHNVDKMLGKYREHTDDQAEAMATLREDLEESIQQLRTQRLRRTPAPRSTSASTLHTSDLEPGSASDGHRYYPTSPLRDYSRPETTGRERRSRSATVRFRESGKNSDYVHSLHQSLRDLRSDQIRLGDDVDREILRRNRTEVETKRALERLSESLTSPQRGESVSARVERRLQEIEKELRSERRCVEKLPEQRVNMSQELLQALRRREGAASESEEAMKSKLLRSECEKNKVEVELERTKRQLDQSEGGRDTLLQQVEDLRRQLLMTEKERRELQQQVSHLSSQRSRHEQEEERERGSAERLELQREIQELRLQLGRGAALSEGEELRRALERKDRERQQLSAQVEALCADLERREQQQMQMLQQLKEIQARVEESQAERVRAEEQRADSERRREEVKHRAQEALRQWKAKCRSLERSLEERVQEARSSTEQTQQAVKEKDSHRVALQSLGQQAEALRKELGEVLGRLAEREEEARKKEAQLSEAKTLCQGLEQEVRETRQASRSLEEEAGRRSRLEERLREENRALEARVAEASRDREALAEIRREARELSARLAHEQEARKEAQRRLKEAKEEAAAAEQQLRAEREARRGELDGLREALQGGREKQERAVQEALRLGLQERQELEERLREAQAEAAADKDRVRAYRRQVDKMKAECDKLMEELSAAEDGHAQLHRKCQLLKQELEEKVKLVARGDDCVRSLEDTLSDLRARIGHLEAEQESVLSSIGAEIDVACKELAGDSTEKLKAISLSLRLQSDPHRWLAETKTKLQWMCEEVKEREARARRLRRHVHQSREEIKGLKKSKDTEQQNLRERISQQERLLESLGDEKRDLQKKTRWKDEELRNLQDRISGLETSTRLALDHLESVPEKLSLLENFKDLEESQRQREIVGQRYARYKEIVDDLQHQLEESKRRIQDFQDEKMDAASRGVRLAAFSSSIRGPSNFLSSSLLDDSASPHKRFASPDFDCSLPEDDSVRLNGVESSPLLDEM
ncbi:hypothetical protein GJAV_G00109270 [Gymnothorax javanicus]|nr:hypothetical protein GJAV_G00109270 [Gymnothorax javanicus]